VDGAHQVPTPAPHLVVVGGGITGLAAAWQGIQRGARVSVVEADDRLGGKVSTVRRDGFVIEQGPDSFVAHRPATMQLIDEVGLTDQVIAAEPGRKVSLLSRGKLRPIPEGMGMVLPTRLWPFVTTPVLSWPDKLRAGLDLVIARRLTEHDEAIGTFLRARLGNGIVQRFADPMVGGIYGASVDELSLDAVLPSLRISERKHRSLMVASLAAGRASRRQAGTVRGPGTSPFRTLAGGMGQLVEALEARLRAAGADLRTATTVESLDESGVHLAGGGVLAADAVILAGGVADSARLLRGEVPAAADALAQIPLGSTTIVSLAWPISAFTDAPTSQGWLQADTGPLSGVTISSVKFAGRAPDAMVLVRVFVPGARGPLADADDEELTSTVLAHVRPLQRVTGEPALVQIVRWHRVRPKYTVGHLDRVAVVDQALRAHRPTWAVAGCALHGVGVPDCIADGRARADLVLDAALAVTVPAAHFQAATTRTTDRAPQ
jgi:oxygen-dependent protoporphyrinogen oxidase